MQNTALWKHFAAFIYDIFPIVGMFLLTTFIVVLIRHGEEVKPHTLWFDLIVITELAFYYTYSWKIGGQTLGMRAWKFKIIPNQNQATMTWPQTSLRFLVGIISTLLLGSGLFWALFSKEKRTWMDLVSDSSCQNID